MDVNVTLDGGFVATKAMIRKNEGEKIVRRVNEEGVNAIVKINVAVCLFKDQAAIDAGNAADDYKIAYITDVAGYNGTEAWLESKIPAAIND